MNLVVLNGLRTILLIGPLGVRTDNVLSSLSLKVNVISIFVFKAGKLGSNVELWLIFCLYVFNNVPLVSNDCNSLLLVSW